MASPFPAPHSERMLSHANSVHRSGNHSISLFHHIDTMADGADHPANRSHKEGGAGAGAGRPSGSGTAHVEPLSLSGLISGMIQAYAGSSYCVVDRMSGPGTNGVALSWEVMKAAGGVLYWLVNVPFEHRRRKLFRSIKARRPRVTRSSSSCPCSTPCAWAGLY